MLDHHTRNENEKIGEYETDNYGDFKLDNLEENSSRYTLKIACDGYDTKNVEVDLKHSLNVGIIFL